MRGRLGEFESWCGLDGLHELGAIEPTHEMPCHHNLDGYLHAYIDQAQLVNPLR